MMKGKKHDAEGMIEIELKGTTEHDLESLFAIQQDREANYLAAFTAKDPDDQGAYLRKWVRLLSDPTIIAMTIYLDGNIVGSIAKFEVKKRPEITYWIDRSQWGKGIATRALQQFLSTVQMRPIYAHVASDNFGSIQVLLNCGFEKIGAQMGFANARNKEIKELVYVLK